MKKIAIIGDFCYPNYTGGSSKHVYDLLINFPLQQCEVKLLTRKKTCDTYYQASDPEAERNYENLKSQGKIGELGTIALFNPFRYLRFVRNADYVLLQHPVMGMLGGLVARLYGKKTIYHYHGPLHLEYQMKTGKKNLVYHLLWLMQKITVACADTVLTHSAYMQKLSIAEHHVAMKKCRFLPPYIKPVFALKSLEWWQEEEGKIKLLIPRRLTARTGVLEFLKQFLKFPESFRNNYRIYITGNGELLPEVKACAESNPEVITYLGFLNYDELWTLYGKVDAVVVPTLSLEGFGYVILEAMSCGAAAIVSKSCGGGFDFVNETLGQQYTFDIHDDAEILQVLQYISGHPNKREYYQNIASSYSLEHMVEFYEREILG